MGSQLPGPLCGYGKPVDVVDGTLCLAASTVPFLAESDGLFFDEPAPSTTSIGPVPEYPETGIHAWRARNDAVFLQAVDEFNHAFGYKQGEAGHWTAALLKAQAMVQSGGSPAEFATDPLQINRRGDWLPEKSTILGLTEFQLMKPETSARAALRWLRYKGSKLNVNGVADSWLGNFAALTNYNGSSKIELQDGGIQHRDWFAQRVLELASRMKAES
jgi:hypothetical protein